MPDRLPIEFECSTCLTRISAPAHECGNEIECSICRATVLVPSRSIDLDLFADIFDSLNGVAEKASQPSPTPTPAPNLNPNPAPAPNPAPKQPNARQAVPPVSPSAAQPAKKILSKKAAVKKDRNDQEKIAESIPAESIPDERTAVPSKAAVEKSQTNDAPQKTSSQVKPPGKPLNPEKQRSVQREEKSVANAAEQAVENQPLVIASLQDTELSTAFGIKCHVCDTLIHAKKTQIGTQIDCPICFTRLKIVKQPQPQKSSTRWKAPPAETGRSFQIKMFGDAEMAPSVPAPRAHTEFPVDATFGLEPVTEDLLSPIVPVNPDLLLPLIEAETRPGNPKSKSTQETGRKPSSASNSESTRDPNPTRRKNLKTSPSGSVENRADNANEDNRRSLDWDEACDSATRYAPIISEMLLSPGLRWRAVVAALLIGGGSGIMHFIAGGYRAVETPQLGDWVLNLLLWLGFGGGPYLLGTLLLWFVSGYVFREAALGQRQVTQWSVGGATDLWETFLIFSFSFLIAGLPLIFVSFLTTPLRFLIAPPLLLSAWFHQSPFSIVAVEVFQNFTQDWQRWRKLYWLLLILAGVSLIAGLLMMVRVFMLSAITSLIGAFIMVVVTIAFAAATGWHCGQVMSGLKRN